MKKKKLDPEMLSEGGHFNITSMIDVSFLILIFFMVSTQMSDVSKSKKLEPVRVENGEPDDKPQPGRLMINVMDDGKMQINAKEYSDKEMFSMLKAHYQMSVSNPGESSNIPIMIRSDKRTKYKDVQKVMQMCMDNHMWKITFAALGPEEGSSAEGGKKGGR